ncbi:MAG: mannose-6-phosphate isomerase, class I [Sphaerochaetaceae bacterium]
MDIVKIIPQIKPYAWGNSTFIPQLLGMETTGQPVAEVWFGTHKGGESAVDGPSGTMLGDFLTTHADTYYGESHLQRFGQELPLLLKILAIGKPLSIQCHPSREQARRGYAAELPLHATTDREQWNYKDPQQKAEVIYALTPMTALCGFRPIAEITGYLRELVPYQFPLVFPFLVTGTDPAQACGSSAQEDALIKRFFSALYQLDRDNLRLLIDECVENLDKGERPATTADGDYLTPWGIARACLAEYPDDPGILAPFFLNVVQLAPGEAVFLEPRTLHAYMWGNGVELMSNSDNVLRGGLTHKKVDVSELLAVLALHTLTPVKCPQVKDAFNRVDVLTPTEEFMLSVMQQGSYFINGRTSIELLLCTAGSATIVANGEPLEFSQGECCVVAASVGAYRLTVRGQVFCAGVPA